MYAFIAGIVSSVLRVRKEKQPVKQAIVTHKRDIEWLLAQDLEGRDLMQHIAEPYNASITKREGRIETRDPTAYRGPILFIRSKDKRVVFHSDWYAWTFDFGETWKLVPHHVFETIHPDEESLTIDERSDGIIILTWKNLGYGSKHHLASIRPKGHNIPKPAA